MSIVAATALVLAAGSPTVQPNVDVPVIAEQPAAGYEALSQNRNEDVVAALGARFDGDEPARLINLGTAYARIGHKDEARRLYSAAVHSDGRRDLVLADGRVLDSREAAKLALRGLDASVEVMRTASRR